MAQTLRSLAALLAAVSVVLAFGSARAHAAGGNYVFDGGTAAERAQVRQALNASAFPWGIVPAQITIRIRPAASSEATPGVISLNAELLDAGSFSWGVVQHEYAHQVDFFLLDDAKRAQLATQLGGVSWWASSSTASLAPNGTLTHAGLSCERFASTLAWSYWQSQANVMRPQSPSDESAAMAPVAFRALIAQMLNVPARVTR